MEQLKSSKQEKFSRLIALDGLSISEAYKQSYNCENMKQDSIYQLSCRLSKQVKIRSRIEQLRESVTDKLISDLAWTKERFIKEAETNLIQSRESNQMNPANTSLQLIGKVTGILEDKPQNQINIGIVETLGKLPDSVLASLEALSGSTESIEAVDTIEASNYQIIEPDSEDS
tara:strand:+ start:64 stop:582 length:519 start_codon:yes stop_codon:yes gene_type:complete